MTSKLFKYILCAVLAAALLGLSGCAFAIPGEVQENADVATEPQATVSSDPELDAQLAGVEHLEMVVQAKDLWNLLDYPNLKSLNLSGSTCYGAILDFARKNPQLKIVYTVDVGGTWIQDQETAIALESGTFDFGVLLENLQYLPKLTAVTFPETDLTTEQVEAIRQRYPELTVRCSVNILGTLYDADTTRMDLSSMTSAQVEEVTAKLGVLANLTEVELMSAEGGSQLTLTDVAKLQDSVPNATFHYTFSLYGKTLSTTDEEISYVEHSIGNAGEAKIREALEVLDNCKRFVLDNCGLDYEVLAGIREDFRGKTKVVWSVDVGKFNVMTDKETFRAVYAIDDSNCYNLRYCEDVKYMDIGHNDTLTDLSFIGYMPNLELLIASGCLAKSIPGIENCKKLQWLELVNCFYLEDISNFDGLESLKWLNLSSTRVTDLSSLDGLELERFCNLSTKVPAAEQTAFQEIHPSCLTRFYGSQPYGYGWRYNDNGYTFFWYYKEVIREVFNYDLVDKMIGNA